MSITFTCYLTQAEGYPALPGTNRLSLLDPPDQHTTCIVMLQMLKQNAIKMFTFSFHILCLFFCTPTAFSRIFLRSAKNSTFYLVWCASSPLQSQSFQTLYCPSKANFGHPDPVRSIYGLIPFDRHLICRNPSRNAKTDAYQRTLMKQILT